MTEFNCMPRRRMVFVLLLFCILAPAKVFAGENQTEEAKTNGLEPILGYIGKSWDTLTRSIADCTTVVDPKLAEKKKPSPCAAPPPKRPRQSLQPPTKW